MGHAISTKSFLFYLILTLSIVVLYIMSRMMKQDSQMVARWNERPEDSHDTHTPTTVPRKNAHTQFHTEMQQLKNTRKNIEFTNNATECPDLTLPPFNGYYDHWQNVSTDRKHFVFSAFVDATFVRLIGATLLAETQSEPIFCQVWHTKASVECSPERLIVQTPLVVNATVEKIMEAHRRRYTAAFFKCPFPKDILPYAVSLVTSDRCQSPLNHVVIAEPSAKKYKFAVCVNTIRYNYNDAEWLVQFIELNRLLGAERFGFYDTSIGPNVTRILDMYMKQDIVELIPWKIPFQPSDIHVFGQIACLNDCFYRHRRSAEYIVITDLDEFLIPRKPQDKTWEDMLQGLPNKGAYIFRNTYFPTSWPNSNITNRYGDDITERYHLIPLLKFDRSKTIYGGYRRAKYIVKTAAADTVGIHFVFAMRKPWQMMLLDPDIGLNHHYRRKHGAVSNNILDLTMLKYRDDLTSRVAKAWERVTQGNRTTQDIEHSR